MEVGRHLKENFKVRNSWILLAEKSFLKQSNVVSIRVLLPSYMYLHIIQISVNVVFILFSVRELHTCIYCVVIHSHFLSISTSQSIPSNFCQSVSSFFFFFSLYYLCSLSTACMYIDVRPTTGARVAYKGATYLKKLPSPNSHQLTIVYHPTFSPQCMLGIWLAWSSCVGLLYAHRSLWVYECNGPAMPDTYCFTVDLHCLHVCIFFFFISSFKKIPEHPGDRVRFTTEHSTMSYSLHSILIMTTWKTYWRHCLQN